MSDYNELVKALRWCDAGWEHDCEYCPLHLDHNLKCMEKLLSDAAAAIEGLVESVHIRDKHLDELNQYIWKLEAEVNRLKEK